MTAKFTKGSWKYDEGCGCVLDDEGDIVCDVMPDGREECEHNGYVLAQAGAMYKMLDFLLQNSSFNANLPEEAECIESLLAKARGEA